MTLTDINKTNSSNTNSTNTDLDNAMVEKPLKQWFKNTSVFVQGIENEHTIELSDDISCKLDKANDSTNLANRELPETLQWLLLLKQHKIIQSMDYHFACFIYGEMIVNNELGNTIKLTRSEINFVLLLTAKLSYDMSLQDACLHLDQVNLSQPFTWLPPELQQHNLTKQVLEQLPIQSQWQDILLNSGLARQFTLDEDEYSIETDGMPLVLFHNCLYMRRYFNYEKAVVNFIKGEANDKPYWFNTLDKQQIETVVNTLFEPSQEIDWQKQAVINSITKPFSVISGGPGTGKTTTVVKLLATLLQLHDQYEQTQRYKSPNTTQVLGLNIQLAAPTGKAAQRLAESITHSLGSLQLNSTIKDRLPNTAVTIHRLLKPQGLNEFTYNENNKLFVDVLIVDEASMVDLSLMSKLLAAVPKHAQVILLGDRQQLSSVETGNVLAEICRVETQSLNLVVELQKSYRFSAAGLIGQLARFINQGNSAKVISLLSDQANQDAHNILDAELNWIKPDLDSYHSLIEFSFKHQLLLIQQAKEFIHQPPELSYAFLTRLFDHLLQFQILTCVKEGEFGVEGINRHIKQRLISRKLVNHHEQHYHCRPVMISENAYHLGLYNGDIGIQLIGNDKQLMTYFLQPDGQVMKVSCQRLPKHETVYAMTVHKSQGSEFKHVALVLPDANLNNKILSREILYTGLTRAKKQFTIFGQAQEIQQAINKATVRQSGLSLLLRHNMSST